MIFIVDLFVFPTLWETPVKRHQKLKQYYKRAAKLADCSNFQKKCFPESRKNLNSRILLDKTRSLQMFQRTETMILAATISQVMIFANPAVFATKRHTCGSSVAVSSCLLFLRRGGWVPCMVRWAQTHKKITEREC